MANKRPKPEEIVTKLRQVEILTGQGVPRLDAIRQIGVTEQTYYRWSAGGYQRAISPQPWQPWQAENNGGVERARFEHQPSPRRSRSSGK